MPARHRRPVLSAAAASLLLVLAAGCAGPSSSSRTAGGSPSSPPHSSSSANASEGTTITVTIAGGRITPAPRTVKVVKGDPVTLLVTSDVATEVHVHGYEIEKPVPAGGPATLTFVADQVGVFEVEDHGSEKLLLVLQVS